jgi:hypothetical protein
MQVHNLTLMGTHEHAADYLACTSLLAEGPAISSLRVSRCIGCPRAHGHLCFLRVQAVNFYYDLKQGLGETQDGRTLSWGLQLFRWRFAVLVGSLAHCLVAARCRW